MTTFARYVIGFGYEFNWRNDPTGFTQNDVQKIVERAANLAGVLCYSLRFGPGAWFGNGEWVCEQGGTVEHIGADDELTRKRLHDFAARIRGELWQDSVVFYTQPVTSFQLV